MKKDADPRNSLRIRKKKQYVHSDGLGFRSLFVNSAANNIIKIGQSYYEKLG